MQRKSYPVGILVAASFVMMTLLLPSIAHAQADPRVQKSMELLKSTTAKLGAPKVEGREAVGDKDAPALYFGSTKMNNNFEIVDAIGTEDGQGMTATLFVNGGDEYIRVTTSVPKPDGSGRAIGTVLDGPAHEGHQAGQFILRRRSNPWRTLHNWLRADQRQLGRDHWRVLCGLQKITVFRPESPETRCSTETLALFQLGTMPILKPGADAIAWWASLWLAQAPRI
jgi:hypothetical protein